MAWSLASLVAASFSVLPRAGAQPADRAGDVQAARDAYQRGSAAFEAGRYAEAAVELARADELAPNAVALQAALDAATRADDPVLAMTLVDRAGRRAPSEALDAATAKARAKFASRVGRLGVHCRAGETCSAKVAGQPAEIGAPRWLPAGDHAVTLSGPGGDEAFSVHVDAGASVEWTPPPRAPPVAPAPVASSTPAAIVPPPVLPPPSDQPTPQRHGLSPTWFWIGVGATGLAGIVALGSGIDAVEKHDAFWDGDDSVLDAGQAAQLRTNVLFGVTAALAVGTAAVGIWLVDWHGPKKVQARAAVTPGGAALEARF